jgi:hypothetical protein
MAAAWQQLKKILSATFPLDYQKTVKRIPVRNSILLHGPEGSLFLPFVSIFVVAELEK